MSTKAKKSKRRPLWLASIDQTTDGAARSEREQALLRLFIAVLGFGYLAWRLGMHDVESEQLAALAHARLFFGFFIAYAAGVLVSIHFYPEPSHLRRTLCVLVDLGGFSYVLALFGGAAAPWFPVYLWVTFGNVLRYGTPYLYLSALVSLAGFGVVLAVSPYWQAHFALGIGLWLSLLILPLYAWVLAQRLRKAQLAAEQASRAKGQFLAKMSHEIRTPLNGIIGAAELLRARTLPSEERRLVEVIDNSGRGLLGLVNDILDLSKIEARKVVSETHPFDFRGFINGLVDVMEITAERKGLRLITSIDPRIPCQLEGDEHHLRQVLLNLLGNAVKFTERGEVELRCMLVEEGGGDGHVRVAFTVRDTGIGIPEERQAEILEPFVQADQTTAHRYGGTGLGTTIARELVEIMGGRLTLTSRPGVGTLFRFELPLRLRTADLMPPLPMAGRSVLALFCDSAPARRAVEQLREWSLDVFAATDLAGAEWQLRRAAQEYSPIAAMVVTASLEDALQEKLSQWQTEGLVNDTVALIVADFDAARADLTDRERVQGRRVRVHDLVELHHALYGQRMVGGLEEPIYRPQEERGAPLNVLIADDNATNRLVLSSLLRNAGHQVHEAEDGQSFLQAIEAGSYDLALVDMHMPDMSGLEVYQMYQYAHLGQRLVPFVIVTADVTETTREQCRQMGIEHVIAKPVTPERLQEVIEALGIDDRQPPDGAFAEVLLPAEEVPLIDLEKIEELLALDVGSGLEKRIFDCFMEDSQEILARMAQAMKDQDGGRVRELAHSLRGSAANVGLTRLQVVAEYWEHRDDEALWRLESGELENLRKLVADSSRRLAEAFGLEKRRPQLRVVR